MTLQNEIDNLAYPPTHTYDLETLTPTNVLADRMHLLPVDFFKGKRLLDIGCNKGFFSLYASDKFNEIVGIDITKEFVDLCNKLKKPNMTFLNKTFKIYSSRRQFDRIFIGNTHHYLFVESEGWNWIHKLAALTEMGGQVLIEGPVSMECADMYKCIPENLRHLFNYEEFIKHMDIYFDLEIKKPTTNYTNNRYIMLFKRKQLVKPTENFFKKTYRLQLESCVSTQIAASHPIATKVLWFDNEVWYDELINETPYKFFENEKEILSLLCDYQIHLIDMGYIELDMATINFFKPSNKHFDKNGVIPVTALNDVTVDLFKMMFTNSYKDYKLPETLVNSLHTHDTFLIKHEWKKFKESLK